MPDPRVPFANSPLRIVQFDINRELSGVRTKKQN